MKQTLDDEQKLKKTFELTELARKLNMARDAAEHPGLTEKELSRRFCRRMVYRKDVAAKHATAKHATAQQVTAQQALRQTREQTGSAESGEAADQTDA